MKSKTDWIEKRQSLRTDAEAMLSQLSPVAESAPPTDVIMHELLVHKVELEMQIEELRRAHDAMEEARDRYLDLYDFAPVGYITLNRDGLIGEINLTGAALLGVERAKLVNGRFAKFVSPPERDLWHRLFINLMEQAESGKRALVLAMARADATPFYGYLECQRRAATLRVALFDISKVKQAEADMQAAAIGFEGLKA